MVDTTVSGGDTLLHLAIKHDNVAIARILLAHNASMDKRNREGNTPMHACAARGNVDVMKELLNAGANIDVKNKDGCTPLCLAVQHGRDGMVDLLVKWGGDPMLHC